MYPAPLDVRNRDDLIVRAPVWRRYPSERHPNETDYQDACFYSVESYQTREKSIKNTAIWVAELVLIIAIILLFITVIVWFPPFQYFSDAHQQLKNFIKKNDTVLEDFKETSKLMHKKILYPYNLFLLPTYALIGFIPILLCVSSWNVGNRSTSDVVCRNVVIHGCTLFMAVFAFGAFIYLIVSWTTLKELTGIIVKVQRMQEITGLSHNQTFLGKIELKNHCCGIRHPLDYWSLTKERNAYLLTNNWFDECSANLDKQYSGCRFPMSCTIFKASTTKYIKHDRTDNHGLKTTRNYFVKQRSNWTRFVAQEDVGCTKKVFFNYFFYIFTAVEFVILIVCNVTIIVILTCAATSRKEERIVEEIYQGREDRLAWETRRIQRQARRATNDHKNMLLMTHVLQNDQQPESSNVNAAV